MYACVYTCCVDMGKQEMADKAAAKIEAAARAKQAAKDAKLAALVKPHTPIPPYPRSPIVP